MIITYSQRLLEALLNIDNNNNIVNNTNEYILIEIKDKAHSLSLSLSLSLSKLIQIKKEKRQVNIIQDKTNLSLSLSLEPTIYCTRGEHTNHTSPKLFYIHSTLCFI
jgi:hypothetical protein